MIEKEGKRGQVTIFIIIAVLIVAICVLIFLYYPKIFGSISRETKNPSVYIQECIEEQLEENIQHIELQGGNYVVNPEAAYFYKKEGEDGSYVRYLCYTNTNTLNTPCINQEPFIKRHMQDEIINSVRTDIDRCFNLMVRSYERKGYDVQLQTGTPITEIIPDFITTNFNRTLTLKKGDETTTYKKFEINMESSLYEMLEISKNIIEWETQIGDSIPMAYVYVNPKILIEKRTKDNDVRIYILTDAETEESFRFAVRSYPMPVGFGDVEG